MDKYIKLEPLLKELEENTPYNWSDEDYEQGEINGYKYVVSIVEAQDTADVAEVKHAHWVLSSAFEVFGGEEQAWGRNPIADCSCSNCHESPYCEENFLDDDTLEQIMTDFCPHCGARMDGERE